MVPKGAEKEKGSAERADDGGLMRMIDADALIEDIKHGLWDWETVNGIESRTVLEQTIQDIKNEPTIDAEPVVRCKDCKYVIPYESGGFNCLTCPNVDRDVDENWFCAYGERKTEVKKNED